MSAIATSDAVTIRDVRTAIVSLPLVRPVITPIHHITTVDNVLVTVTTDAGVEGIAYLWCFGETRARVLAAMVADLARFVVGADPRATVGLWQKLWGENNFFGRAGVALMAQSAIDVACWDIKARVAGEPLWRLLGGTQQEMPLYAGGLFLNDSLDDIVAEARRYVARGFRGIKMRTGAPKLATDIERVGAVRSAIGPDVTLMVDAVQGWTATEAIRAGRALAQFDLAWIEDPVAFDDHAGLAAVAAALDTPVCAGENDYSLVGFERLIAGRAIDIAMADLQRVGGITEWMRVAALTQAARMPVTPHVFHEIMVHVASAVPNVQWLEYVPWWETLFVDPLPVVEGRASPSNRPGHGLAFAWDRVDKIRIA